MSRVLGTLLHNELSRRTGRCQGWRRCAERYERSSSVIHKNSPHTGTGVRINCISPGQIDVGVDLKDIDMKGLTSQLPPASLQTKKVSHSFSLLQLLLKFVPWPLLGLCLSRNNGASMLTPPRTVPERAYRPRALRLADRSRARGWLPS